MDEFGENEFGECYDPTCPQCVRRRAKRGAPAPTPKDVLHFDKDYSALSPRFSFYVTATGEPDNPLDLHLALGSCSCCADVKDLREWDIDRLDELRRQIEYGLHALDDLIRRKSIYHRLLADGE